MNRIEVKSKEYEILSIQNDTVLYTANLNEEIAYSVFSAKLLKVGLARNIDMQQLKRFFAEVNPNNIQEAGLIKVYIVGGEGTEESTKAAQQLISQLQEVDGGSNIIDILSYDTCDRFHPNSFEVDCYHGGIRGVTLAPI